MSLKEIEDALQKSTIVVFHFPFIAGESAYVKLGFENPDQEENVYNELVNTFPKTWTLAIYKRHNFVDLCMIENSNGTIINIKNLTFDPVDFKIFLSQVDSKSKLLLTFGHSRSSTNVLPAHKKKHFFFSEYNVIP